MVPVTLINLDGEESRWRSSAGQLARSGLMPVRLPAVAGAELPAATRSALYDAARNAREYHRPLCPGEIGCYASHLEAWRRLVDSGATAAAIVEDDIEVDADLPSVLEAIARIDVPWDLVKLVGRPRESPRGRMALTPDRDLIAYRRVPSLTAAYVLRRRGAEKLLARRVPFGRPVDVDIRHWWECDLRVLGVDPYPVRLSTDARRTTIVGRTHRRGLPARWHRLALQMEYTWHNWLAMRKEPALPPVPAAPPTRAGSRAAAVEAVR